MAANVDPLIGRHFQAIRRETQADGSATDGVVWQGRVLASPLAGFYLVQLLDYAKRGRSIQRLVRIEMMLDWEFFEDRQEMLEP